MFYGLYPVDTNVSDFTACASTPNHQPHLHGDSIHLHIHCTNAQLQLTRDASNTDIAVALKHLGALFHNAPYDLLNGCESFRSFLSGILHQYDAYNGHDTSDGVTSPAPPFNHSTMYPRTHHNITSSVTEWNILWPTMNTESPELLTYTHGLVSSPPPANYTCAWSITYILKLSHDQLICAHQETLQPVCHITATNIRSQVPPLENNTTHHARLMGSCERPSRPSRCTSMSPTSTWYEIVPPHPQGVEQGLRCSNTTSTQCPNHCRSPGIRPHAYEHRGM